MSSTCRTCSFYNFEPSRETGEEGQCRKHGPWSWKYVRPIDWCGEYEQRQIDDKRGMPKEPERIMPLRVLRRKIEKCEVCLNGAPYIMCADHFHELTNITSRIRQIRKLSVVQEIIKLAAEKHDETPEWKKPHTGPTKTDYQDLDTIPDE